MSRVLVRNFSTSELAPATLRVGTFKALANNAPYRSGPSKTWIKFKNPKVPALSYCPQPWRNTAMGGTITIASLQSHSVRQLLIYCLGKRDGDWPCHHSGKLSIDRFEADEVLQDIEGRYSCTVCGWRRADLRPDYRKQQTARKSVGWMMPPS